MANPEQILLIIITASLALYVVFTQPWLPELKTVNYVDVEKYQGKWYEIAVLPYIFEYQCTGTNANYTLNKEGYVEVHNQCFKKSLSGKVQDVYGKAYVEDKATNAKLQVYFNQVQPIPGNYWIIDLDQDYQWVVVGAPSRRFFWILCRTPQMDTSLYNYLLQRAYQVHKFDISKVVRTIQPHNFTETA